MADSPLDFVISRAEARDQEARDRYLRLTYQLLSSGNPRPLWLVQEYENACVETVALDKELSLLKEQAAKQ